MRPFGFEHFAQVFVNRVMVHGLVLPDMSGDIDFPNLFSRHIFGALIVLSCERPITFPTITSPIQMSV
jgi:hypothetical protein